MDDRNQTQTWPDLAIGLYDKLTGRNAEITYQMENLAVQVPSGAGTQGPSATWKVDGTLKIRTRDGQ